MLLPLSTMVNAVRPNKHSGNCGAGCVFGPDQAKRERRSGTAYPSLEHTHIEETLR